MSLLHIAVLGLTAEGAEGSTRRAVFAYVQTHPGLHQRELARELGLRPSHAEHHLHHLVRAGLVHTQSSGRYLHYFPAVKASTKRPVTAIEKPILALLRQPRPLEAVARLLQGDMQMGHLAEAMRIKPSTLSHHAKRLEKAALVRRWRQGHERWIGLQDRAHMIEILLAYEPPADLVAGFEELWDDIAAIA